MHKYFRVDSSRRKKQGLILLLTAAAISLALFIAFKLVIAIIYLEDSLVGVRVLLLI